MHTIYVEICQALSWTSQHFNKGGTSHKEVKRLKKNLIEEHFQVFGDLRVAVSKVDGILKLRLPMTVFFKDGGMNINKGYTQKIFVDLMKYIVKRSKSQGVVKYFNFHFLKKLSASRYC